MYGNLFEAGRLDAKYVEAHLKLGQLYLAGCEFDKAAQEVALVKQLKPDDLGALTLEGVILFAQGKKLDGLEAVRRALKKEPAHFDAISLLASLYLTEGQYAEALSVLKQGIEAYPQDFSLPLLKIRAEAQSKDYEAAVNDYHALIAKYPDKQELIYGLVGLLSQIGRQERAEAVLKTARKTNPNDIAVVQMLVQVRVLKKDWSAAQALAAELGQQPNGSAASHFLSGEIFARQGNYDEAIKQFQQALLEKPDFAEAIRDLAQAYHAAGKPAQLSAYLKAFISHRAIPPDPAKRTQRRCSRQ